MGNINCFTGDGAGKSSSAFGKVLRAWGQEMSILVVQFLKGKNAMVRYGEAQAMAALDSLRPGSITHIQCGLNRVVLAQNITEEDINEAEKGWQCLKDLINENNYDLIVIDELLPALQLELLDFNEVMAWLKLHKKTNEIIITGRIYEKKKKFKIKEISELYSELKAVKHPFNMRCDSCMIEYTFRDKYCSQCGRQLTPSKKMRKGIEY